MDEQVSHEERRQILEIEKLQAEIKNLKNRWWIPTVIQIVPGCLLVLATVIITWSTGIIDVKRDRLAAETERLTMDKARLEETKVKIESEVVMLRKQLERTDGELLKHASDKAAITAIHKLFPMSTIQYHYQVGGYVVGLETIRLKIGFDWIVNPSNTLPALKEIGKLSNVAVLHIQELPIGDDEGMELSVLHVPRIAFTNVRLDDAVVRQLSKNRTLKAIAFTAGCVSDKAIATFREERPDVVVAPDGFEPDEPKPAE